MATYNGFILRSFIDTSRINTIRKGIVLGVNIAHRDTRTISATTQNFIASSRIVPKLKGAILSSSVQLREIKILQATTASFIPIIRPSVNKIGVISSQFLEGVKIQRVLKGMVLESSSMSRPVLEIVKNTPTRVPRRFPLETRWNNK